VSVEHKNSSETTWSTLVAFSSITAAGVSTANGTAIEEQLRFVFSVGGTPAANAVHFNVLAPAWRP
jgi:hypothetical protein